MELAQKRSPFQEFQTSCSAPGPPGSPWSLPGSGQIPWKTGTPQVGQSGIPFVNQLIWRLKKKSRTPYTSLHIPTPWIFTLKDGGIPFPWTSSGNYTWKNDPSLLLWDTIFWNEILGSCDMKSSSCRIHHGRVPVHSRYPIREVGAQSALLGIHFHTDLPSDHQTWQWKIPGWFPHESLCLVRGLFPKI